MVLSIVVLRFRHCGSRRQQKVEKRGLVLFLQSAYEFAFGNSDQWTVDCSLLALLGALTILYVAKKAIV